MSGSHLVIRTKRELQTTQELTELMELMKQVAAAQLHTLEAEGGAGRGGAPGAWRRLTVDWGAARPAPGGGPTSEWPGRSPLRSALSLTFVMEEFFRLIPPSQCAHPFLDPPADPLGIVIVTSDEGFVGGLNTAVMQAALESPGVKDAELIVVGARGRLHLEDLRRRHTAVSDLAAQGGAERLRDYLVEQYVTRRLGHVVIFYTAFHSFARQEVASTQLLPYVRPSSPATLSPGESGAAAPSPSPAPRGQGQGAKGKRGGSKEELHTILEPSGPMVIEYLGTLWLGRKISEIFRQARQSELAARIVRLEANGQELLARQRQLKLQYFKAKHEVVDGSLRETYAGLLLKKQTKAVAERMRHVGD